jgi:hypothetical protein
MGKKENHMSKISRVLAAVAVIGLFVLPGVAGAIPSIPTQQGGPYTATVTVPLQSTNWPDGLYVEFPKFDNPLATLVQMDIRTDTYITSYVMVTNHAVTPCSGQAWTHAKVGLADPQGLMTGWLVDWTSPAQDVVDLQGGDSESFPTYNTDVDQTVSYFAQNILTEFTGTGMIQLPATTDVKGGGEIEGNWTATDTTRASLTGTITYYYTPEPATLVLLALGGLMMLRRRHAA